jgi:hypothetical protein
MQYLSSFMAEKQKESEPRQHVFTNQSSSVKEQRGKYNVSLYQYPSNLHELDLLHYVEFNINVRGKSTYNPNRQTEEIKTSSDAKLSEDAISTVATLGTAAAVGIATGVLVNNLVKKYIKRFESTGAKASPVQKLVAKAATLAAPVAGLATAAATAEFINMNDMLKPDTKYRITDVINLYVDGPPTVKYSMNYANKELGTLAGLVGGAAEGSMKSLGGVSESGAAALTAFAKLPGAFGVDVQSALSVSAKTSLNPFKEVIFESVDFRSFSFKYKFMPKSKQESDTVKAIIELFKFHMHPEMSDNKLFFIYPAEFQITYYFANNTNDFIHKFAPCVLESMDVSFGGEQYSSFADGTPTEVNMSLVFRETEIITKKMLENGGY